LLSASVLRTCIPNVIMQVAAAVKDLQGVEVGLVPPFPFLYAVRGALEGSAVTIGAQNSYVEEKGAFTGAVSTTMLSSVGCAYALCGHSERRVIFREDNVLINKKVSGLFSWPSACMHHAQLRNWLNTDDRYMYI
jgi:triosephosphate isomerase (TIM)